jgi:hypothetical protein
LGVFQTDTLASRSELLKRKGQQHSKETVMKELLIALTLVTAFAAPAALAEGFPNPYQTTMNR